jgi:hypothetical protein
LVSKLLDFQNQGFVGKANRRAIAVVQAYAGAKRRNTASAPDILRRAWADFKAKIRPGVEAGG